MKQRKILVVVLIAVLTAGVVYLRRLKDEKLAAENLSNEGGETAAFFKRAPTELKSVGFAIDCKKPRAVRASVGDQLNLFWQNTEDEEIETFLHFDPKSRVLSVCHKGVGVAAVLPENPDVGAGELVRVSEAQFGDMNGDGKNEFFVFQGQCAEGPCLGDYLLMQIDGDKIRKLYDLRAETVEVAKELGRNGLRLEKYCYTYEFGMGPAFFSVAEFSQDGELKTVPYQELRDKFPIAVAQMKPSQDLGFEDDSSAHQKAYLKIHDLIVQAYKGKPLADLLKAYDGIVAELPPVEEETSPGMRLNLYCETREILELISGH